MTQLEEIGEQIRLLVFEDGLQVAHAVDQLWPTFDINSETARFLMRRGLIDYANNQLSAGRSGRDTGWVDRNGNGKTLARIGLSAPEIQSMLIRHSASDGTMKPLLDFTGEDWGQFLDFCMREVTGWSKRASVARWAMKTLADEGKAVVRELDVDIQKDFAQRVEDAWRGP